MRAIMRAMSLAAPLPLLALLLLACGDDAPAPDAGADRDAGRDAALTDGGPRPDAGDAGVLEPLVVDVSAAFPAGTSIREAYTGESLTVGNDGTVRLSPHTNGVLLFETAESASRAPSFSWDNATVYFVVTDRFENGNPANDSSFGRTRDGAMEVGTFHGGDLAGLTERLDHLSALGVNAVWITPPVEQITGWVGGGDGSFRHYPYHGYWANDFTKLDPNFGTEAELSAFVDAAHARGIRVIFDVVMNHPGYASMQEIATYLPTVIQPGWESWAPGAGETWHSYHAQFIDYTNPDWANWWGPRWIRAGLAGGYDSPGQDDLKRSLASLPDFRTEDFRAAELPPFYAQKDTDAVFVPDFTVRDYLVSWHADWVRRFGIDGFRADTAKHVELAAWAELDQAATAALAAWKAENPEKALDDRPFWMTGEVFPHGVVKDAYFTTGGFDSLINFDFQTAAPRIIEDFELLDGLYETYAGTINTDPDFNVLSYISSHDTNLFFALTSQSLEKQLQVGTALLLAPGGVQIFYGDESGRAPGPTGGELQQSTRSDMNWDSMETALVEHWQKVGQFRNRHPAVGAGSHERVSTELGYAFVRRHGEGAEEDRVMVVLLR